MIASVRESVRGVIDQLEELAGVLAEADKLPALESARAMVALDQMATKLDKLTSQLQASLRQGDGQAGGRKRKE